MTASTNNTNLTRVELLTELDQIQVNYDASLRKSEDYRVEFNQKNGAEYQTRVLMENRRNEIANALRTQHGLIVAGIKKPGMKLPKVNTSQFAGMGWLKMALTILGWIVIGIIAGGLASAGFNLIPISAISQWSPAIGIVVFIVAVLVGIAIAIRKKPIPTA